MEWTTYGGLRSFGTVKKSRQEYIPAFGSSIMSSQIEINMICQIYVMCKKSFFAKSCSPFNLYPVRNYVKSHMDEKNWEEQ